MGPLGDRGLSGGFIAAAIDVKPGPFSEGVGAAAVAELILPAGGGASEGDTIVPFRSGH
jgi:hypothetical protein